MLDVGGELPLVGFLVILKKVPHVVGDVDPKDVLPVNFGIELFGLVVVTRKPFGGVRNVDAAVDRSLHGAENSGTCGGSGETGVEAGSESSRTFGGILNHVVVAINFGLALVDAVQMELLENLKH